MKSIKLKKKFYCCSTDARHEMFEQPVTLYPTMAKLKKKSRCWEECGITEITISGRVVVKGKF